MEGPAMRDAAERCPVLFSPTTVAGRQLANRLIMAPLYTGYATVEGRPGPYMLEHYREMGASGLALVVVETTAVAPGGIGSLRMLRAHDDSFLEGLGRIASEVKAGGALACCQINHCGRFAFFGEPVAPSPVAVSGSVPRELAAPEIRELVRAYVTAAARVKQAGFDMVELHGGTGYLLASFVSPRTNQRTDAYGGSLENRMRFPLEVLAAVRDAVGPDFPVGYRFLADEWLPDGLKPAEALRLAAALEKGGAAYLSVLAGTYESFFLPEAIERSRQQGYMAEPARAVKEVVSIPVIAAGRIATPALAEDILTRGQADLIGLARVMLADPEWVRKAREDRASEIVHCKVDCDACMSQVMGGRSVVCAAWSAEKKAEVKGRLRAEQAG
jgi:2,4-dienoyl-CoA reductase-like NADH-dependent reductase (Old Yellow Enzyme family)